MKCRKERLYLKFEVEVTKFAKITVEAESKKEAEFTVAVMDDDELESRIEEDHRGWIVW